MMRKSRITVSHVVIVALLAAEVFTYSAYRHQAWKTHLNALAITAMLDGYDHSRI